MFSDSSSGLVCARRVGEVSGRCRPNTLYNTPHNSSGMGGVRRGAPGPPSSHHCTHLYLVTWAGQLWTGIKHKLPMRTTITSQDWGSPPGSRQHLALRILYKIRAKIWESWDFHFLLDRSEVTPEMKHIMQRWPNIKILSSKLRGDDILGLVTSEVGLIMQITTKNMAADKIQPNAVENLADDYSENYYDSGVRCELR